MPAGPSAKTGRRGSAALSSPITSTHNSSAAIPKLKLTLRSTPTPPLIPPPKTTKKKTSKKNAKDQEAGSSSTMTGSRTRKAHSDQRQRQAESSTAEDKGNFNLEGSDSDLTPDEDEDDDDEDDEMDDEAMSGIESTHVTPRTTKKKEEGSAKSKAAGSSVKAKERAVGTSGPGGRERKRAIKNEDVSRRRARDAKFGVGGPSGEEVTPTQRRYTEESEASDNDDSTHPSPRQYSPAYRRQYSSPTRRYGSRRSSRHSSRQSSNGLGHDDAYDETHHDLPDTFEGQEIEDLAYGAGPAEIEVERHALSGLWDEEEDEDDEMFISTLSGSEAELQSQSSVQDNDSDAEMSEYDEASSTTSEDEVDEFGFPLPTTQVSTNAAENGPLVLMENWDGQFVLVQPRQDRRSRRDSRGSRTAGSVGASTTFSTTAGEPGGLIIDPDAIDGVASSESEWSGASDEDDGDTTDSMAEEDMPMLDSPALDQLIGEQMANVSMGVAVNGSSKLPNAPIPGQGPPPPASTPLLSATTSEGPVSIVVTDTTNDTTLPIATPGSVITPLMPSDDPSTPQLHSAPTMGTFHPATDHPAQHAVIDGSKNPTKSPFTHRRRSRSTTTRAGRGRSESLASFQSRDERERKRRSSTQHTTGFNDDVFAVPSLPKRLRYSSIPGHPRFVAAKRAAQASMSDIGDLEREDTPSGDETTGDSATNGMMDLEDMLDESFLSPSQHDHDYGFSPSLSDKDYRFDRVPVSAYLKRHFGGHSTASGRRGGKSSSPVQPTHQRHHHSHTHQNIGPGLWNQSSPFGLGVGAYDGLEHTLAGPAGRMLLLSPTLNPLAHAAAAGVTADSEVMSRREKRRRKRRSLGLTTGMAVGQDVPPLTI